MPTTYMEYEMHKKRLNKFFVLLLTLPFLSPCTFAKSGSEHTIDMLKVLGLYTDRWDSNSSTNLDKLEPLTSKVNYHIDHSYKDPNGWYQKENGFKSNFDKFGWGDYGHRILNHWGFDMDEDVDSEGSPTKWQYPSALLELFRKWSGNDNEATVSDWHRFLKFLKGVQAEINQDLIRKVGQYLGINSLQDARDVAALLYYVHLLGDHAKHEGEHTGEAVLEMKKISRNIEIHVRNLAKKDWKTFNKYKTDIKSISSLPEKEYAEKFIEILIKDVSVIIQHNFEATFASKGLYSPENMDLRNAA